MNPVLRPTQRAAAPAAQQREATGGTGLGQDTYAAQNPYTYNGRYPGYGYQQPGYGYPTYPQQPTYPTYPQQPGYPPPGFGYGYPDQPTYPTYPTYPQPGYGHPGYPGYGYPPGAELGYAIGNLVDSFKQLFGGR